MTNVVQQLRSGPGPLTVPAGNMYAGLLPEGVYFRTKDFFAYSVAFIPLAAGTRESRTTAIENDSDFLLVAALADIRTDATPPAVNANSALLVRITAAGSGRNLMDSDLPIQSVMGTAQLPAYWPYPKLLKASATLETQLVNNQGADQQVRITYWGFKVFGNRA